MKMKSSWDDSLDDAVDGRFLDTEETCTETASNSLSDLIHEWLILCGLMF